MKFQEFSLDINGTTLSVKKSVLANQADGSILVSLGETTVLATAVMNKKANNTIGYFPLSVNYEEKFYAAGKINGSRFIKREGRPSDKTILNSRLIDRSLRPLFNHAVRNDIQIVVTVLSLDNENEPSIPALIAASTALSISDIPWDGPLGIVRVGIINDKLKINPTLEEQEKSPLDVVFAGTEGKINMMEGDGKEIPEDIFVEAFILAQTYIDTIAKFQKDIVKKIGAKKRDLTIPVPDDIFVQSVLKFLDTTLEKVLFLQEDKPIKTDKLNELKEKLSEHIIQTYPDDSTKIKDAENILEEQINSIVHKNAIEKDLRPDGRNSIKLRALESNVSLLPRIHGSGLFIRGETQVLSILTLGAPGDAQLIDGMEGKEEKFFMHHYNFPPFSVGEARPMRGPSRRDIGHGALAERAMRRLMPDHSEFPYTIRLVSETLSSNGSSSMASICASVLAMMDGGVPIKKISAGIAMGLMSDNKGNYKVLTDIQGPEDHHGDMDLKVAGTKDGITAVQMDVKISGITHEIFHDTLIQAKEARLEILKSMQLAITEPRKEISKHAPHIVTIKINPEKIGSIIGPGGKVINAIIDETGAAIDIEDSGNVFITSSDAQGMEKAVQWIKDITREAKVGEIYQATVKKIMDFGAFVEIFPGTEGLVHISKLSDKRVEKVTDIVKEGDILPVKLMEIDKLGRLNLSAKDAK